MAMKGIFQKSILVVVWMVTVLLAGCDKEGKNGWLYSEGQDFCPISNLTWRKWIWVCIVTLGLT